MKDGLGNWADAATHIGTRTKEDCEQHYLEVYLGVGPNGEDLDQVKEDEGTGSGPPRKKQKREFMPVGLLTHSYDTMEADNQPMDMDIKVNHDEFQEKKRQRIEELRKPHGQSATTPILHCLSQVKVLNSQPFLLEHLLHLSRRPRTTKWPDSCLVVWSSSTRSTMRPRCR